MPLDIASDHLAAVMTPRKSLLVGWGEKTCYAQPPENEKPAFYFPDFFLTDAKPWHQFENHLEISDYLSTSTTPSLEWQIPYEGLFVNAVNSAMQSIEQGLFQKVVAYASATAQEQITPALRQHLFKKMWQNAHAFDNYAYCYWSPSEGIVGASPEQLFIFEAGKLSTVACAGTAGTDRDPLDDKLCREHQIVLDELLQALSKFSKPQTLTPYWKKAGNELYHWVTPIEAELTAAPSYVDLVHLLHPTPAIGAYPKEAGMAWLKDYNQILPRGRYGAPVGYLWNAKGEGVSYPAIRNIQWSGTTCTAFAGCGVVEGSDPELEWNEWNAKFKAIRVAAEL